MHGFLYMCILTHCLPQLSVVEQQLGAGAGADTADLEQLKRDLSELISLTEGVCVCVCTQVCTCTQGDGVLDDVNSQISEIGQQSFYVVKA